MRARRGALRDCQVVAAQMRSQPHERALRWATTVCASTRLLRAGSPQGDHGGADGAPPHADSPALRWPKVRVGTIEEPDGPLLSFASNASSFCAGQVFTIDSGLIIQ